MRLSPILFLLTTLTIISCNDKETPNGYQFTRHIAGDGPETTPGDYAFIHVYAKHDGVIKQSTRDLGQMMPVIVPDPAKMEDEEKRPNAIADAVSIMRVGDSVSVIAPKNEQMMQNPELANVKEIVFDIVLMDVKSEEEFKAYQAEERQKEMAGMEAVKKREAEVAALLEPIVKDYEEGKLADRLTTHPTTGLKYLILEEGNGEKIQKGQQVSVHYYGVLPNGEMFDNSFRRGQAYPVRVGAGNVIQGWDIGLTLLNSGDKAVLIIPSDMGYGKAGSGKIPGDSELIFYVEPKL